MAYTKARRSIAMRIIPRAHKPAGGKEHISFANDRENPNRSYFQ